MPLKKILIVDDEPLMRQFLAEALERKQYEIQVAESAKKALPILKKSHFDLVITDMNMPEMSGLELLRYTKEISPQTQVLVMTAFGTIENAVEAMHEGAFNYLLKPFTFEVLEAHLAKAKELIELKQENRFLKKELHQTLIAKSPVMQKILKEVRQIATSQASVFIQGESGTGKEVIAGAIHAHSRRSQKSYICVNCAAIPDTLIESEFFGHEKGAFTGANQKRIGRFEAADGGTLLLDEVTEIPLNLQPKLLRVLQEQQFERIGGSKSISVDVRIIATSNRDLKQAMREKVLREDLYYRLNVIPIHLPPLRDRKEDIIPLASYFLESFCQKNHKSEKTLSKSAEKRLLDYQWPGNIRELANIIERVVVLDYGHEVKGEDLLLN